MSLYLNGSQFQFKISIHQHNTKEQKGEAVKEECLQMILHYTEILSNMQ